LNSNVAVKHQRTDPQCARSVSFCFCGVPSSNCVWCGEGKRTI